MSNQKSAKEQEQDEIKSHLDKLRERIECSIVFSMDACMNMVREELSRTWRVIMENSRRPIIVVNGEDEDYREEDDVPICLPAEEEEDLESIDSSSSSDFAMHRDDASHPNDGDSSASIIAANIKEKSAIVEDIDSDSDVVLCQSSPDDSGNNNYNPPQVVGNTPFCRPRPRRKRKPVRRFDPTPDKRQACDPSIRLVTADDGYTFSGVDVAGCQAFLGMIDQNPQTSKWFKTRYMGPLDQISNGLGRGARRGPTKQVWTAIINDPKPEIKALPEPCQTKCALCDLMRTCTFSIYLPTRQSTVALGRKCCLLATRLVAFFTYVRAELARKDASEDAAIRFLRGADDLLELVQEAHANKSHDDSME